MAYGWTNLKREKIAENEPHVSCGVRCHGKIHRVLVDKTGAFVLRDHTKEELQAFDTLIKMGAEKPRCMQVKEAFLRAVKGDLYPANQREDDMRTLPPEIRAFVRSSHGTRLIRSREKSHQQHIQVRERAGLKSRLSAWRNVRQMTLRSVFEYGVKAQVGFSPEPFATLVPTVVTGLDGVIRVNGPQLVVGVGFKWAWWNKLGLGILDDKPVVNAEIRKYDADVWLAQHDGVVVRARAIRMGDGTWTLDSRNQN